jgi:putative restriction endonuclease
MIAIAPTDEGWLETLTGVLSPSEVNFWTPTPWNVAKLNEGDRFYFLLKAPYRKVASYGHYRYYENMSARDAWDRFGKGNGVNNFAELVFRASKYAKQHSVAFIPSVNPAIGCIVLENPIFYSEDEFFAPEEYGLEFPNQVVKYKYFDIDSIEGSAPSGIDGSDFELVVEESGNHNLVKAKDRPAQATFRQRVLAAYGFKCCATGEGTVEVLDAAHVQPYVNKESNHVQNGLPLRADFHRLFDAGLITLDDSYRIVVSDRLNSEYYAAYEGQQILMPHEPFHKPSSEALWVHRNLVFRA